MAYGDQIVANPGGISAADGDMNPPTMGKAREYLVASLHGEAYTQCYRGNVFIGAAAAAGIVPPIYSNTAQTFMIWNPAGSGKLVVPISLNIGLVTVGVVTDNLVWAYFPNAGSQLGTAAPVSALTAANPVNAYIGHQNQSITRFAPATATVLAPSLLRPTGITNFMAASPTAENDFYTMREELHGSIILGPGNALFLANNIAGVATYNVAVTWAEIPV